MYLSYIIMHNLCIRFDDNSLRVEIASFMNDQEMVDDVRCHILNYTSK